MWYNCQNDWALTVTELEKYILPRSNNTGVAAFKKNQNKIKKKMVSVNISRSQLDLQYGDKLNTEHRSKVLVLEIWISLY